MLTALPNTPPDCVKTTSFLRQRKTDSRICLRLQFLEGANDFFPCPFFSAVLSFHR